MPTFYNGALAGKKRNYFTIENVNTRKGSVEIVMVTDAYNNWRLEIRKYLEGRENEEVIIPNNDIIEQCMEAIQRVKGVE